MTDSAAVPRPPLLDRWTFDRLLLVIGFVAVVPANALLAGGGLSSVGALLVLVLPAFVFVWLALWKGRPWPHLAAGITIALFPILSLAFGALAFLTPQDGPTFAGMVLGLLALLFALPAGVQGFRKSRRGLRQPTARERLATRRGLVAIAIVAMCVGAIVTSGLAYAKALSTTPGGAGYDFEPGASVQIAARNFAFAPRNFNVTSDTITEIIVVNEDPTYHTFTYVDPVNGERRSHDLLSGSTTRFLVFFPQPDPDPVRFWCIPHEYAGMVGTFTVS